MPENEKDDKWCFPWDKTRLILAVIGSMIAICVAYYTFDCWNIRVYGDTVFAKDSEFAQWLKIRKLERKIKEKTERVDHLKERQRDDLLWLSRVRDQYPDVSQMPLDLRKAVVETETQQRTLEAKIQEFEDKIKEWQEELDELELEIEIDGKDREGG